MKLRNVKNIIYLIAISFLILSCKIKKEDNSNVPQIVSWNVGNFTDGFGKALPSKPTNLFLQQKVLGSFTNTVNPNGETLSVEALIYNREYTSDDIELVLELKFFEYDQYLTSFISNEKALIIIKCNNKKYFLFNYGEISEYDKGYSELNINRLNGEHYICNLENDLLKLFKTNKDIEFYISIFDSKTVYLFKLNNANFTKKIEALKLK